MTHHKAQLRNARTPRTGRTEPEPQCSDALAHAMFDKGGQHAGAIGISTTDPTDRERNQEALAELNAELEACSGMEDIAW